MPASGGRGSDLDQVVPVEERAKQLSEFLAERYEMLTGRRQARGASTVRAKAPPRWASSTRIFPPPS